MDNSITLGINMERPFSQACENNKQPILSVLELAFSSSELVLEVGSGTGQHAIYLAKNLAHLTWQTSDLACNHQGINQWLSGVSLANLQPPIALDLNFTWPVGSFDGIFTANTLHIVSWRLVENFFTGVAKHLTAGGSLCVYGPFNYQGQFTSVSNADFDLWLKGRDPDSGIRDIEAIERLAIAAGLALAFDHQMPANNRLLVFRKI